MAKAKKDDPLPEQKHVRPRPLSGVAAMSPEERRQLGRIGGLVGNHKRKGFAVMTPQEKIAIARMGALARITRKVFTRRDALIAARISNHGDTIEQAVAYVDALLATQGPTTEQRLAHTAASEADAVAEAAKAAGHDAAERNAAVDAVLAKHAAPVPRIETPSIAETERPPEIIDWLEAELAIARAIKDRRKRAAYHKKIGDRIAEMTAARRGRKRGAARTQLAARLDAAIEDREARGYDDSDLRMR